MNPTHSSFHSDSQPPTRGLVIGLGSFGTAFLAHTWDRFRRQDEYRRQLKPWLPRFEALIKFALIHPSVDENHLIMGGIDNRKPGQAWNRTIFLEGLIDSREREWRAEVRRTTSRQELALVDSYEIPIVQSYRHDLYSFLAVDSKVPDFFRSLLREPRQDPHAQSSEAAPLHVFLAGSLAEGWDSALIRPIVMHLRSALEKEYPIHVTGLFSTAINDSLWKEDRDIKEKAALVFQGIQELEGFLDGKAGADPEVDEIGWQGMPFMDSCYLLDLERDNKGASRDETDLLLSMANLIESWFLSPMPVELEQSFGPDREYMKHRKAFFGTFGSSSRFIPVVEWVRAESRKLEIELIEQNFLASPSDPMTLTEQARLETLSNLASMAERLLQNCPGLRLEMQNRNHPLVRLLQATFWEDPLVEQASLYPLPLLRIDLRQQNTRVRFQIRNPRTGRNQGLPPVMWLYQLARRLAQLGMAYEDILPGHDLLGFRNRLDLEFTQGQGTRTLREEWREQFNLAVDGLSYIQDQYPPGGTDDIPEQVLLNEPSLLRGLLPEFQRRLCADLEQDLKTSTRALPNQLRLLDGLVGRLGDQVANLTEYRIRLDQAVQSNQLVERMVQTHWDAEEFRRRLYLTSQPGGWLSRGLQAWILIAVIMRTLAPPLDWFPSQPSLLFAVVSAAMAGLLLGVIAMIHRFRLLSAIWRVQASLLEFFEIDLNREFAEFFVFDTGDGTSSDRHGILPYLQDRVQLVRTLVNSSLDSLRARVIQLRTEISQSLESGRHPSRQPLEGMEGLKQEVLRSLQGEARLRKMPEDFIEQECARRKIRLNSLIADNLQISVPSMVPGSGLGDFLSNLVEGFIDEHPLRIRYPDVKLVDGLERSNETAEMENPPLLKNLLRELQDGNPPLFRWDPEECDLHLPISKRYTLMENPPGSAWLGRQRDLFPQQILPIHDPYSITSFSIVQGFSAKSWIAYERYKKEWDKLLDHDKTRFELKRG